MGHAGRGQRPHGVAPGGHRRGQRRASLSHRPRAARGGAALRRRRNAADLPRARRRQARGAAAGARPALVRRRGATRDGPAAGRLRRAAAAGHRQLARRHVGAWSRRHHRGHARGGGAAQGVARPRAPHRAPLLPLLGPLADRRAAPALRAREPRGRERRGPLGGAGPLRPAHGGFGQLRRRRGRTCRPLHGTRRERTRRAAPQRRVRAVPRRRADASHATHGGRAGALHARALACRRRVRLRHHPRLGFLRRSPATSRAIPLRRRDAVDGRPGHVPVRVDRRRRRLAVVPRRGRRLPAPVPPPRGHVDTHASHWRWHLGGHALDGRGPGRGPRA